MYRIIVTSYEIQTLHELHARRWNLVTIPNFVIRGYLDMLEILDLRGNAVTEFPRFSDFSSTFKGAG